MKEKIKAAVCISGFLRDYRKLMNRHFQDFLEDPRYKADIYISAWDLLGLGYYNDKGRLDQTQKIDTGEVEGFFGSNLVRLEIEEYAAVKERFAYASTQSLFMKAPWRMEKLRSQFYKVTRALALALRHNGPEYYDVLIRMRSDIVFDRPIEVEKYMPAVKRGAIVAASDIFFRDDVPLGDHFAFGNTRAMNIYCSLYQELYSDAYLGLDDAVYNVPEKVLAYHLSKNDGEVVLYGPVPLAAHRSGKMPVSFAFFVTDVLRKVLPQAVYVRLMNMIKRFIRSRAE